MEPISRCKALTIEIAVVVTWLVLPSLIGQAVVYTSHSVPASRDAYRYVEALIEFGKIAGLGFIIWQSGDSFRSFGIVKDNVWRILGITVLLLALNAATLAISSPGHSYPHVNIGGLEHRSLFGWIGTIAFTTAAAILEELIFRSYLITRLEELLGSTEWAIVISFITFGCMHIYRGQQGFISASIFGLMLSIAFVKTRSIIPLALTHSLHNLWLDWAMNSLGR